MSYIKKLTEGGAPAGMRRRYNNGNIRNPGDSFKYHHVNILLFTILSALALCGLFCSEPAHAGAYLDSAHGNSSYGVKRNAAGFPADYTKGLCAHCHEQHASIDGAEPEPVSGPGTYTLFYDNYVNQTDGFCFACHNVTGTYQNPPFNNYNYSYRAGGYTAITCPVSILSAFSFINETGSPVFNCSSAVGTSHKLTDIQTFIAGKWGYTADSNPCAACHNPHSAQRDPHTSGSRGWPVSLPSLHDSQDNNAWGLWGDVAAERINNYTSSYQAPYRYNSTVTYEPDGSTTQDGSNLTDYVTFCTDCHNTINTIYSTTLGRNLRTIDWNNEKHGKGNADGSLCGDAPYPSGTSGLGKVLSCTDCHEPHGSPNVFLTREEVNGGALAGSIGAFSTTDWQYLCDRCHNDDQEINGGCQADHYYITHHSNEGCNTDRPYNPVGCGTCHDSGGGGSDCMADREKKICTDCHYHGSSVTDADDTPTTRRTF